MSSEVKLGTLASLHNIRVEPHDFDEIVEHYSIPAWESLEPELVHSSDIESSKILLPDEEHILVSCLNPSTHKVWRVGINKSNVKRLASTEWAVVIPRSTDETDFINSALEGYHFQFQMNAYVTGTTNSHQRVKKPDFLHLTIPFPAKNIRDKTGELHNLLRRKTETNNILTENCSNQISSLFRSWFIDFDPVKAKSEGNLPFGMDEETAALFPDSFEDSILGLIPAGWRISSFNEVSDFITDGAHESPPSVQVGGVPMASVKDMRENWIHAENCRMISEEDANRLDALNCIPKNDDLLIAKDGSILKHIVVFDQQDKIVLLSSIALIRLNGSFGPYFAKYYLESPGIRHFFVGGYTGGSAIPRFVLKEFKKFPILVPPQELMNKFSAFARSLHNKITSTIMENDSLSKSRSALLPRLISGELEV